MYGSVVVHDIVGRRFASFIVMWWHGVYVVRGDADLRLGTFASVEAAIRVGQSRPHPTRGDCDDLAFGPRRVP